MGRQTHVEMEEPLQLVRPVGLVATGFGSALSLGGAEAKRGRGHAGVGPRAFTHTREHANR